MTTPLRMPSGRASLWDTDLAELTDEQLTEMIADQRKREARGRRMVRELLVEGPHYGYRLEEDPAGKETERPFLRVAGAEVLRGQTRYHVRTLSHPLETLTRQFVNVTVELGVYTQGARLLATGIGSCNSKEPLFKPNGETSYKDPREIVHHCLVRASQRAEVLATREAFALTAIFADAEEHRRVFEDAPLPKDFVEWTDAERASVRALVQELRISKARIRRLVCHLFGRPAVATGEEARLVLEECERIRARQTFTRFQASLDHVGEAA
jgi:hypothetical protein